VKNLRKYLQLPKDEKWLFFEAVVLLFFSKVFLLLPFRVCIQRLKPAAKMRKTGDPVLLRKISVAVSRANKLAFWKNVCLVKSFTARLMLQRRDIGSVLYLGLQIKGHRQLVAHAWLMVDRTAITPKHTDQYKEIFSV